MCPFDSLEDMNIDEGNNQISCDLGSDITNSP